MFGTTNDVEICREYKIDTLSDTLIGTIKIIPNNKGQVNFGDLYIDNKFICTLYDEMGDALFDILSELKDY